MRVVDDFTLAVRWKTQTSDDAEGKDIYQMKYMAKSLPAALRPLACFVYQQFADGTKIIPDDSDPNTYRTNPGLGAKFFPSLGPKYHCQLRPMAI